MPAMSCLQALEKAPPPVEMNLRPCQCHTWQNGCQRITASGDAESRACRNGPGNCFGAFGECIEFEYANWAVPDDGAGGLEFSASILGTSWGRCQGSGRLRLRRMLPWISALALALNSFAVTTSTLERACVRAPRAFIEAMTFLASSTSSPGQ